MENKNESKFELVIGIVMPIGTEKNRVLDLLRSELISNGLYPENVNVTAPFVDMQNIETELPKSLIYYLKMQICSALRKATKAPGILAYPIILDIKNKRNGITNNAGIVYLIDQLKNVGEYKILKHVYGINYVQLSIFSSENARDHYLEKVFDEGADLEDIINEDELCKRIMEFVKINNEPIHKYFKKEEVNAWVVDYIKNILKDASSELISKDYKETDPGFLKDKSGQQVADLFHRSTYFINVDKEMDVINKHIQKFVKMLLGKYEEYPTQDEFGMSLAYQASVRSNFPSDRHVGAAIISEYGEVLSVASIRAPSRSSNTTLHGKHRIEPGYKEFKDKIEAWEKILNEITNKVKDFSEDDKRTLENLNLNNIYKLKDITSFIHDILDFHPCTHAEIAAIIDAAKVGISIRNATLYSTTYPCQLCAKDIKCAGIKRVVYLEAFPKSKSKELYIRVIHFEPEFESELIPFEPYSGISSRYYLSLYSLDNRQREGSMFSCEIREYYEKREEEVFSHLKLLLKKLLSEDNEDCDKKYLCNLIHPVKK